jgi:UDP-N-acetylglucosamine acyltransferase
MIQGGSLVRQDVPPFVTMRETGSYAGINKLGLQRRGFTSEQLEAIHNAYRIIFQSDLNFSNACNEVENTLPQSPERDYILEFVRASLGGRGVIKKYGR